MPTLKEALIAQLQKQIEEMGKALHRREQSLKRYTNPTTGIAKEDLDDLENANQPVRV